MQIKLHVPDIDNDVSSQLSRYIPEINKDDSDSNLIETN